MFDILQELQPTQQLPQQLANFVCLFLKVFRAMASTTASASSWSEIKKQTPSTNSTPDLTNVLADFISSSKQFSSTICNEKNNIKNCQSANTSEKNVVDKNLHNIAVVPDSVVQLSSTKKSLKQRFVPSIGNSRNQALQAWFQNSRCGGTDYVRTPREKIAFTVRPKIQSQSQIFRYGRSIFCLPHRPKFSDL